MKRRLPAIVHSTVNKLAHRMAQAAYSEQQGRFTELAAGLVREGLAPGEVVKALEVSVRALERKVDA